MSTASPAAGMRVSRIVSTAFCSRESFKTRLRKVADISANLETEELLLMSESLARCALTQYPRRLRIIAACSGTSLTLLCRDWASDTWSVNTSRCSRRLAPPEPLAPPSSLPNAISNSAKAAASANLTISSATANLSRTAELSCDSPAADGNS
eukprot:scaffold79182_cov51-Prasinocladus_malaysianus.AAC.5